MITWLKEKVSVIGITKYIRIENYLKNIENNIEIKTEKDKDLINDIKILINDRILRLKKLYFINNILYFGIYFSFISFFFSFFFLFFKIKFFLSRALVFFGSTIFFIVFLP